jgi:hypothetical protein
MLSEPSDARAYKANVVSITHPYRLPMRAGVEHNFFVLGESRIDNGIEIEQSTERRFGASLATGEKVTKFTLLL